jgi:hypothetical protein
VQGRRRVPLAEDKQIARRDGFGGRREAKATMWTYDIGPSYKGILMFQEEIRESILSWERSVRTPLESGGEALGGAIGGPATSKCHGSGAISGS